MVITKDNFFKIIKFTFMLVMGVIITVRPSSLLSMLLLITGIYLCVIAFNSFVSTLSLIKYHKGWVYDGVRTLALAVLAIILVVNSVEVAKVIYGFLAVLIGLFVILVGVMAIVRTREVSSGIFFIIVGTLIALFPMDFSYLVIRVIGISLIIFSSYLLYSLKARSF